VARGGVVDGADFGDRDDPDSRDAAGG